MSGESSMNVNQPPASNNDNQGIDPLPVPPASNNENQGIDPLPVPPAPPLAYRLIIIPNGREIITVLSYIATQFGQPMYIINGTGYVSQAEFIPLQFPDPPSVEVVQNDPAQIVYLSGWFHPRYQGVPHMPTFRAMGCYNSKSNMKEDRE